MDPSGIHVNTIATGSQARTVTTSPTRRGFRAGILWVGTAWNPTLQRPSPEGRWLEGTISTPSARHPSASKNSPSPTRAGMVLPLVLVLLGLCCALIIQAQWMTHHISAYERRALLKTQLQAAALDAVWIACHRLAADPIRDLDHTNEPWALPRAMPLPNGIRVETVTLDENRFLDINNLALVSSNRAIDQQESVVRRALTAAGYANAAALATRLREPFEPQSERTALVDITQSVRATNATTPGLFQSPEDLYAVIGEPGPDADAAPLPFTVLPHAQPVATPLNLNTAERAALDALFGPLDSGLAESVIQLRNNQPLPDIRRLPMAQALGRLRAQVSVKSEYYSILSVAEKEGSVHRAYALVYRNSSGAIDILRWVWR